MTRKRGPAKPEIVLITPDEPPELTPAAAHALWKLLVNSHTTMYGWDRTNAILYGEDDDVEPAHGETPIDPNR